MSLTPRMRFSACRTRLYGHIDNVIALRRSDQIAPTFSLEITPTGVTDIIPENVRKNFPELFRFYPLSGIISFMANNAFLQLHTGSGIIVSEIVIRNYFGFYPFSGIM